MSVSVLTIVRYTHSSTSNGKYLIDIRVMHVSGVIVPQLCYCAFGRELMCYLIHALLNSIQLIQHKQTDMSEIFVMRIIPLVKHKCGLNLTDYSSIAKLTTLSTDLFALHDYMRLDDVKPVVANVLQLWTRHYDTLRPMLESGVESIRKLLTDEEFRRKMLARVLLNVQLIAIGLQIALASVFVFQCTRLWSIRRSIKEAFSYVQDQEVKHEFELIELKIEKFKRIGGEVEKLIDEYEQCDDQKEMSRLVDLIGAKLVSVESGCDISLMIYNLQSKFEKQRDKLNECDERFNQTGLGSLSTSGIGLLSTLIRDKLSEIVHNLTNLANHEADLKCTVEQMKQLQERRRQIECTKVAAEKAKVETVSQTIIRNIRSTADGWRVMASSYINII